MRKKNIPDLDFILGKDIINNEQMSKLEKTGRLSVRYWPGIINLGSISAAVYFKSPIPLFGTLIGTYKLFD